MLRNILRVRVPGLQGLRRSPTSLTRRWTASQPDMFCFQCEQTENGTGCTVAGVCGKEPTTATLQDLLVHSLKGTGWYAAECQRLGADVTDANRTINESMFSTLTNVNFDEDRMVDYLKKVEKTQDELRRTYEKLGGTDAPPDLFGKVQYSTKSKEDLEKLGQDVGVLARKEAYGDDNLLGLTELATYGLKGLIAYTSHARDLGQSDPALDLGINSVLKGLTEKPEMGNLLGLSLKVGELNLRAMELLENGHKEQFGTPSPTQVRTSAVKGKCILVSGHDLPDLKLILEQTEGKGINVYTHGELLPAAAYPEIRKYDHFAGNYGGPWQLQRFEFSAFPGPVVMTSNCIIEPLRSYKGRIFTRRATGWPGVEHIEGDDFSDVIDAALECEGFDEDEKETTLQVGFHKDAVLAAAPQIVELIQQGVLKDFFVIGGCDGSEGERSYYTDIAKQSDPESSLILTMGCGKYRLNQLDLGNIGPFPRLLDMGQCNDAYGAVQVAQALAGALKTDINSLPIHYAISWFEQKAVAVLLSLLHLGVQNIYLGPNLPGFVTPDMLNILVEKYNIKGVNAKHPDQDFKQMMGL